MSGQRSAEAVAQSWPFVDPADPAATRDFAMFDFVRMLGGEFFFLPSIPTLRALGSGAG